MCRGESPQFSDIGVGVNLNNKSKYICYYITGLLAGFGEYALYKVNVLENTCCVEDPSLKSCEFRIEKSF